MKKLLSFSLIIALLVGIMPTTTLATVHSSNNSTISNTSFATKVSNITHKYWNDNYFSTITMMAGKDGMIVDGEKKDSTAAVKNNGELMLPIVDIAKSMKVPTSVDEQTGKIVLNGKEIAEVPTVVTSSMKAAKLNSSAENTYTYINTDTDTLTYTGLDTDTSETLAITNTSKTPSSSKIKSLPNGIQVYSLPDGSKQTKAPLVNEIQTENALGLDVHVDGNNITITKPYQTKELIVQTNGATLLNTYGSIDSAYNGKGMYLLQYSTEEATRYAEHAIKSFSYVKSVQPNGVVHTTGIANEWGETHVQADRYKPIASAAGGTAIVAVIDTGVDVTHEFLAGRTVPGFDFVDNDSSPEDVFGHGTHVSGIIANNTPINVKIMPIKVLNDKGSGDWLTIELGIEYAISHGANVINMSLGGTSYAGSDPVLEGVSEAVAAGVTVVVAAGNDNSSTDNFTPAKSDKAITVAASTQSDTHAGFSNYGKAVDIAAPGVGIKSSIPGNNYASWNGTSMATPFVAAAVAMQKLVHPTYSPAALKKAVESTTVDCGSPGWDSVFGSGVLDYGILLGDHVPASEITVDPVTVKFQNDSLTPQSADIDAYISPSNATDKSYTVTSSNPSVAIFQDGKIIAKGSGTATITVTLANEDSSATCIVNVAKTERWIDYHASAYAGGNGLQSSPYLISNAAQLTKLAYDTRIGGNQFEDTYFKLTADIDLSGKQWSPISTVIDGDIHNYTFQGNFDGANHKVKNMTIQQPKDGISDNTDYIYAGLFGFISKGYIKNLAVTDAYVDVTYGGGILAHESDNDQIIDNCYTSGYSSGSGFMNTEIHSFISNCFSTTETGEAGFIQNIMGGLISNCYASGDVNSAGYYTGGFAGQYSPSGISETNSMIVNSFSTNITPSGTGFSQYKLEISRCPSTSIFKCYYLANNPFGVLNDENKDKTDLTAKNMIFFTTKASYTTLSNWNSKYAWDFNNKWAINPSVNNGLPYLKSLGAPTTKKAPTLTNSWIDYASSSYAGGNGTKVSPYLISTPQQLARIAKIHRYGGGQYMYYKLIADIDLSGHNWLPIGYGKTVNSDLTPSSWIFEINPFNVNRAFFVGNILGDGHTISNMNIDVSGDIVGFVGILAGGTMKDLSFVNSNVSGRNTVGSVAGINCDGAIIANCIVSGEVTGNNDVGGFVGYNDFDGELTSDTAKASVIGSNYVAGLTSINFGSINTSFSTCTLYGASETGNLIYANRGTISNSYSKSKLVDGTFINGLGIDLQCGRIINCYSFGTTPMLYSNCYGSTMQQGVAITDDHMMQLGTFDGWDFNSIWGIDPQINDGYPYLKPPVVIPVTVLPTTKWEDYKANSFAGGDGTSSSPYLIESAGQLAYMAWGLFYGILPNGTSYKLISDIDLSGHLWLPNNVSFVLMANINLYFDGNGHVVNNMTMSKSFGLFGNLNLQSKSVIENLGITNIKGNGTAGITHENSGKIINCYTTGIIRDLGQSSAAGLVTHNNGLIEYCYSTCNVSSYSRSDGLIAFNNNGKVQNCYSRGTIYCQYNGYGINENSSNCYSTNIIIGSGNPVYYYDDCAISSYYDEDIAGVNWGPGRSTTEMKTPRTYVGWDFKNIWGIDASINNGYPYLKYNYNGLPSYTVSYDANGGTGTIASQKGRYTSNITMPSGSTLAREGNVFTGWSTSPSGQGNLYSPSAIFSIPQNDVKLFAQWAVACTITFNANGGIGGTTKIFAYNKVLTSSPTTPTRSGYTFDGWYTAQSGGTLITFPYTVSANATLYAHWNLLIPVTPTSIKAVTTNYNTIKISWETSANSNQYKVYRATSSTGPYTLVGTVSTLTFANSSLTTGNKYYYKVMACNIANGRTSGYSKVVSVTPLPATVKLSTVKKTSSTSAKLSYPSVSGASGYEVWYKASSSKFTLAGTSTNTSYTKKKLKAKKVYYFKVRAYRKVGTKKVYGAFSLVKSVRM